ncbi:MAG: class I SAM-dependent methyltransferase [Alphaproteobacteria bacterium]|nr:class I SAM-dependent methyltransferase [Alphaproteobacteria bacterium]
MTTPACKLCAASSVFFDRCNFHNNAQVHLGYYHMPLPPHELMVDYYRCTACGFMFTPLMDEWGKDNIFATLIYNKDYPRIDGTYNGARAGRICNLFYLAFHDYFKQLEFLDYGGGIGLQSALVGAFGAKRSMTFDPFAQNARRPDGQFHVISCVEVLEHAIDPLAMVADLVSFNHPDGLIFLTTECLPDDIDVQKTKWWYVNPRVGHVSFFPKAALEKAFAAHGYKMTHIASHTHIAYKTWPIWADHLISEEDRS